jgi:putative oxidoreductase
MFMMHGFGKLFGEGAHKFLTSIDPVTKDLVGMGIFGLDIGINMLWVAGFIEFFGGILLVIGLMTRWAAGLSALLMVMAYTHKHLGWNPLETRGEMAVLYFLIWLLVFAYGAGPYSLDAKFCPDTKKELKKRK